MITIARKSWEVITQDWGFFNRRAMIQRFIEAIDEAEAHANTEEQGESESAHEFKRGYLMGLCLGAAMADIPEDVWASPQRHRRQRRLVVVPQRDDDYTPEALDRDQEQPEVLGPIPPIREG